MRTNIQPDGGFVALRTFVRRNVQRKFLELRGKVRWEGDLDRIRERRF